MNASRMFAIVAAAMAAAGAAAAEEPAKHVDLTGFLRSTCGGCHGPDSPEAGLRLDAVPLTAAELAADPDALSGLVRGHDRLRDGEMPPRDADQPLPADRQAFLDAASRLIEQAEARLAAGTGRTTVRRMNRIEYEHVLRDLLSLPSLRVRDLLPEDGRVGNFDKLAAGLDISYVQMARYLEAASRAVEEAVAPRIPPPQRTVWREPAVRQGTLRSAINIHCAAPLIGRELAPGVKTGISGNPETDIGNCYRWGSFDGAADSVAVFTGVIGAHQPQGVQIDRFRPPVAGRYTIRFSTWGLRWQRSSAGAARPGESRIYSSFTKPYVQDEGGGWRGTPSAETEPTRQAPDNLELLTDAAGEVAHVVRLSLRGQPLGYFDAPSLRPTTHEITVWLAPEDRVSFHAMTLPSSGPANWPLVDGVRDYEGPGIAYDWFEVEGPLDEAWPPASHRRLFGDLDRAALDRRGEAGAATVPEETRPAVARLLGDFAERAFRRPVTPAEVTPFEALVMAELESGRTLQQALLTGYRGILCSPDFLLVGLESLPAEGPDGTGATLGDHALASRLSLFLWNSLPDEPLRGLADAGRLSDPATLAAEAERMLADPRAERFVDHFLDEWLQLRDIDFTTPDPKLYPEFDPWLRDSILAEPRVTFRRLLDDDLGVAGLIDGDRLVINQRLAILYGLEGVDGAAFREVPVPAGNPRGGLMTQAAVLKVTANGTATSPVLRGVWVMERLLGIPRLPPPPDIPAIEPDATGATTVRQLVEMHRADSACAVCHDKMDPYGLALEAFDPIGGLRDRYRLAGRPAKVRQGGELVMEPFQEVVSFTRPIYGNKLQIRLGSPVDPSGELADGRGFEDVRELKRLLREDPDAIAGNLARQLVMYATGGPIRFSDRPEIDRIVAASRPSGHGLRTLVKAVILSDLFRTK